MKFLFRNWYFRSTALGWGHKLQIFTSLRFFYSLRSLCAVAVRIGHIVFPYRIKKSSRWLRRGLPLEIGTLEILLLAEFDSTLVFLSPKHLLHANMTCALRCTEQPSKPQTNFYEKFLDGSQVSPAGFLEFQGLTPGISLNRSFKRTQL